MSVNEPKLPISEPASQDDRSRQRAELVRVNHTLADGDPAGAGSSLSPDLSEAVDESVRSVITAAEVARVPEGGQLLVRAGVRMTPLAVDLVSSRRIIIRYQPDRSAGSVRRIVAVGADHGGFEVKSKVCELLNQLGAQARDFGTHSPDPIDYPEIAHTVARAVADGRCDLGILLDGAGIGSCMAANKVPGIRAALCYDEATARNSREHNFANILTLGAKMHTLPELVAIITAWLSTPPGGERHARRVAGILAIERHYSR